VLAVEIAENGIDSCAKRRNGGWADRLGQVQATMVGGSLRKN